MAFIQPRFILSHCPTSPTSLEFLPVCGIRVRSAALCPPALSAGAAPPRAHGVTNADPRCRKANPGAAEGLQRSAPKPGLPMRCSMRWGHPRPRPTPSPHAALMQHGSLPCMAHRLVHWAPQVRRGDTGSVQSQIQPFWVGQPHPQASRRLSQLNSTNHPSNILNPPINKSKCIPLIEPLIPAQSLSLTGNGTPRLAAGTVLTKAAHHNHKWPFPPSFLWFQVVLVSVRAQQCRGIGQTRATVQGDFVLAGLTKRSTAEGCKMSCGNESALWDIIQLLLNRIHHPLTALLCAKRERRQPKASETSKAVPYQHGEAWGKHHRIPP